MTDTLEVLQDKTAKVGLKINWLKAKIMSIEPQSPVSPFENVTVYDAPVELVRNFSYLGSVLANGKLHR